MSLAIAALCAQTGALAAASAPGGRIAALRAVAGVGAAIAFGTEAEAAADRLMEALADQRDAGAAMARIAAAQPRGHDLFLGLVDCAGRTSDLHGPSAPEISAAASRPLCVGLGDGAPSARIASILVGTFSSAEGGLATRMAAALAKAGADPDTEIRQVVAG